jgi:DNA helicase-2/ATP-dependent DNA helicase PcrA
MNAQSLGFENEFLRRGIPYQVVGSLKFYEREEVKDGLALLAFLANPRDEVAFRRVVNKPPRGLGPSGMNRILTAAGEHPEEGLIAGAWRAAPVLTAKARAGLKVFLHAIEEGRAALEDAVEPGGKESPGEKGQPAVQDSKQDRKSGNTLRGRAGLSRCLAKLLEVSGLAEYHRERDDLAGTQRLNNLQELVNASSMYPANRKGLLEFLEHLELDRSREEDSQKNEPNGVTLITLHNTKGLEFPRVILTGVEKGIFPREDKRGEDLEEERRLFYVGATRAKDELYFTCCAFRRVYGNFTPMEPGLFLEEIDPRYRRVVGQAPSRFLPPGGRNPGARKAEGGARSSDGRWAVGDRIFQDDRGYGAVIGIEEGEDGPVVRVRFETGGEMRFLSLHQSGNWTKIGDDV